MDIILNNNKKYSNPCSNCSTSQKNTKIINKYNQINKKIIPKNENILHFFPNLNQINK